MTLLDTDNKGLVTRLVRLGGTLLVVSMELGGPEVALDDMGVVAPPLTDELLAEGDGTALEEALGESDAVLDETPPTLLGDDVDTPAEVVLGKPDDELDAEALIDIEMLLVDSVELAGEGEVNGWLDVDAEIVDSGYGPMSLELAVGD